MLENYNKMTWTRLKHMVSLTWSIVYGMIWGKTRTV